MKSQYDGSFLFQIGTDFLDRLRSENSKSENESLDCKNETLRVWQAARQGTVLLFYLIFRCLVWLVFYWSALYIARGNDKIYPVKLFEGKPYGR